MVPSGRDDAGLPSFWVPRPPTLPHFLLNGEGSKLISVLWAPGVPAPTPLLPLGVTWGARAEGPELKGPFLPALLASWGR